MKTMKGIRFGPALLGLVLFSATAVNAHTCRSRLACGVVERPDKVGRTVQFSPKDGKAPTELALDEPDEVRSQLALRSGRSTQGRHKGGGLLPHAVLWKTVRDEIGLGQRELMPETES